MQKSKRIYLDHASTTPLEPVVLSIVQKTLKENFANPGSIHELGVKSKNVLEQSREETAKIIGAHNDEIIFTSGATESNNLAILGIAQYLKIFSQGGKRWDIKNLKRSDFEEPVIPHIVTTNIEHPSVLETCRHLEESKQAEVTYVPVEANGIVDPKKIKKAIKPNTVLVSVMYANNEIGTIQPIMEIAKEIRHFNKMQVVLEEDGPSEKGRPPLVFHSDATQAINYLPIKVEKLGVDLMSFNGGKIYGPKGTGILYIKRKTPIEKILFGGDQEFGFRPGTENVALIAGLTEALKITEKIKIKENKRLLKLRNYFIEKLMSKMVFDIEVKLNGDKDLRLPNNVNITIPKIPSDLLVLELSARGIYVSEKSACKSGDKAGSYVIQALHQMPNKACKKSEGSLRFSLGRQTTKADIDYVLKSLFEILEKLKKWYN